MSSVIRYTWQSFGDLLSFLPIGKNTSGKKVFFMRLDMKKRRDRDMLARDFLYVGKDIKTAMEKLHGQE